MKIRLEKTALPLILILAIGIRLYPIAARLPHTYWHDENSYIEMALRFGKASLDLITYAHGNLYQAVLFIVYAVYYAVIKISGLVNTPVDFYLSYLKDPTPFFIIARAISVLCGTGIVYLSYLIAAKIYNKRAAFAAGIFSGFTLLMVQMSSIALADMLSVFILLSAVLLLVHSIEKAEDKKLYYSACFLVGLAAGCKYYAAFGIAPLFVAALIKRRNFANPVRLSFVFPALGMILLAIGFFIGMPFFIFNFPGFYNDTFVKAVGEYIVRNPNKQTWLFYFTHHLRNGLGLPLEAAALLGIACAFYKRSKWDMFLLSFPVTYYLLLMHSVSFAYHMLPAIPFVLILAGRLLDAVSEKYFRGFSSFAFFCLLGIAIVPTFFDSVKYVTMLAGPDTRTEAKGWVDENIPGEATVLSEGYIATLPVHTAPLSEDLRTLKRDLEYTIARKGSGFSEKLKIANYDKVFNADKVYEIFKVGRVSGEDVEKHRPSYIILSGSNDIVTGEELSYYIEKDYYLKREMLRKRILRDYMLLKVFSPVPVFSSMFPHMVDRDYRAIRNAPLCALKHFKTGPTIEIYRRK